MGAKPTRDKIDSERRAPDLPDTSAPPPHDAPRADIHDLPRNEGFRHGAVGGPAVDARLGESGTQEVAPTEEDIQLEATLLQQASTRRAAVDEWLRSERRFAPGLEAERDAPPARGSSPDARTDDPDAV
jgi:hypothetical protein